MRGRIVSLLLIAAFLALTPHRILAVAILPPGFVDETIAVPGLGLPYAMAIAPDGRVFICEQAGSLRVVKDDILLPTAFVTVTVDGVKDKGLIGVAIDPDFETNQYIYIHYTVPGAAPFNRVSRFTANGDVAVEGSEVVTLDEPPTLPFHIGGAIHFGADGKLYISVGDNGIDANAQSLQNTKGKILRINKDGSIPPGNPFYSLTAGLNRAIWSLGLRNPFTFGTQPATGRVYVNDVGNATYEEINDATLPGANFGWPSAEGPSTNPAFTNPLYYYLHSIAGGDGCAVAGGTFYNPATSQFPSEYVGRYFFQDLCSGWIRTLDPQTNAVVDFGSGLSVPVDIQTAPDGSIYYLTRSSQPLGKIRYTTQQAPFISQHPSNQTVPVGQAATFTVVASGASPLSYQWQREGVNITGAMSSSYTLTPASNADNGAHFRCVVSNAVGTATSNSATLTVAATAAPTATITAPVTGTLYSGGSTVNYAGTGTNQNGSLPPSAFTWQVDFHHDEHLHPSVPATSGATSGSFVVPRDGEVSANVWYRILLTVTNPSSGLSSTVYRDVLPRTITMMVQTNPAGLQFTLDGQPTTTTTMFTAVVGIYRTIGTSTPQTLNGTTYTFSRWSDGGQISHQITTPAKASTFTAYFAGPAGSCNKPPCQPPPPPPPGK